MRIEVIVVGGGLAGSEAAWQAAERGANVALYEMRPRLMTPVHVSDRLAELVCSNSLGSNLPDRAAGVLKAEMRRLGSLILDSADRTAVPAGGALAVDREAFADLVTARVTAHPHMRLVREEMPLIPDGPCVIASGPLTSDSLSASIARLGGQEHLYFYDALAPIVASDTIDTRIAFRASRYGRASTVAPQPAEPLARSGDVEGGGDYINCPLTKEEYARFVEALLSAERISLREFERPILEAGVAVPTAITGLTPGPRFGRAVETAGRESEEVPDKFFESCLPIEIIASRGFDSLAFGPMRPIGLKDPRTGRRPYAVAQLRQDNLAGTLYNMVGFQTNLAWPEQKRVLRLIPGLANAEFVRYGQMHRNTFINAPRLLEPTLQFRGRPDLFFAGQITGVEGYMGNAATGLLAGANLARWLEGRLPWTLPETTMLGALCWYVTHAEPETFQPMKANFGLMPPLDDANGRRHGKRERARAYAARALADLTTFLRQAE